LRLVWSGDLTGDLSLHRSGADHQANYVYQSK